jgi:hypothetical protein
MATPADKIMDRDRVLAVLTATGWQVQGNAGAAAILGVNPTTLAYRMKRMGLERPKRPLAAEHHLPVVKLLAELDALRAQARTICRVYLPGLERGRHLRELETQQRRIQAQVRKLILEHPVPGGLRGNPNARGSMRPAWEC